MHFPPSGCDLQNTYELGDRKAWSLPPPAPLCAMATKGVSEHPGPCPHQRLWAYRPARGGGWPGATARPCHGESSALWGRMCPEATMGVHQCPNP